METTLMLLSDVFERFVQDSPVPESHKNLLDHHR